MSGNKVSRCAQFRLCVVFFLTLAFSGIRAGELADVLWQRIEDEQLWDDPGWWTLGHYHRTMWLRVESRIDDPAFFLHPGGKTNRRLELKATLEAFLSPVPGDPDTRKVPCRFPARRKWLLQKLDLPAGTFPAGDCGDFKAAVAQLQIESATMIYPAGYLNSPASMFGHLLLVLDREEKDRLLARAVNYAAVVNDSFGPLFAVKGIFGLYEGVYAILPYYDKVEEYSAVNRRDIWEYPLKLTPDELDSLLRHVWELQSLRSRYFFFKENCAFNLLYPIQVARPALKMVRRFRMSAAPVSLLQQLVRTGVTGEPLYRPSKATLMESMARNLSHAELKTAQTLVEGAEPDGSESALILTFASEWLQYRYTEQEITPEEYRKNLLPLLRARSKMGKVDMPKPARPVSPDQGHPPRKLGIYGGFDTVDGRAFTGIRLRASYHDWLDDPAGYPSGSVIRMFEGDLRGYPDTGEVTLNEFILFQIRSLTPPAPWVKPLSWTAGISLEADPFERQHHRIPARFGAGFTFKIGSKTMVYGMMNQLLMWDSSLEENFSWEPGVEWGLMHSGNRFRPGIRGWHNWGVLGCAGQRHKVEAEIRIPLHRSLSLGISDTFREESGRRENLAGLNLYLTF